MSHPMERGFRWPRTASAPALALLVLASAAGAQPAPPGPIPSDAPASAPAPTAEAIAEAYLHSIRVERERVLRRAEAAIVAARRSAGEEADDGAAFIERLRAGPDPEALDPAEGLHFVVALYGCAPAAGEPGHVCTYGYGVEDARAGVSAPGPALVRAHLFPGPDGLLVHELPLPDRLGPREGPGSLASGG